MDISDVDMFERAEADKDRMSATRYVAGYITYKVSNGQAMGKHGLLHN